MVLGAFAIDNRSRNYSELLSDWAMDFAFLTNSTNSLRRPFLSFPIPSDAISKSKS